MLRSREATWGPLQRLRVLVAARASRRPDTPATPPTGSRRARLTQRRQPAATTQPGPTAWGGTSGAPPRFSPTSDKQRPPLRLIPGPPEPPGTSAAQRQRTCSARADGVGWYERSATP